MAPCSPVIKRQRISRLMSGASVPMSCGRSSSRNSRMTASRSSSDASLTAMPRGVLTYNTNEAGALDTVAAIEQVWRGPTFSNVAAAPFCCLHRQRLKPVNGLDKRFLGSRWDGLAPSGRVFAAATLRAS